MNPNPLLPPFYRAIQKSLDQAGGFTGRVREFEVSVSVSISCSWSRTTPTMEEEHQGADVLPTWQGYMSTRSYIPPSYDGDCATFEEWKYNFMAYIRLVDHLLPSLLTRSETATRPVTNERLMDGAVTIQEGTKWINLATEPRCMINITKGPAARVDKQESIPTGLKHGDKMFPDSPFGYHKTPQATSKREQIWGVVCKMGVWNLPFWEGQQRSPPRQHQMTFLMNGTRGARQQHLQLRASNLT